MTPGMPEAKAPKLYLGVPARLVFPDPKDEKAVLALMRRFSAAHQVQDRLLVLGVWEDQAGVDAEVELRGFGLGHSWVHLTPFCLFCRPLRVFVPLGKASVEERKYADLCAIF